MTCHYNNVMLLLLFPTPTQGHQMKTTPNEKIIKAAKAEIIQLLECDDIEITSDNISNYCEDMMENLSDCGEYGSDRYVSYELLHAYLIEDSNICDCKFGFCFNQNHL